MDGWENFPGNMKEILERFSNCKYERGIIWSNAVVSFVLKMYLPGDEISQKYFRLWERVISIRTSYVLLYTRSRTWKEKKKIKKLTITGI